MYKRVARWFSKVVYFDSLATNRMDPSVLDAMMPYQTSVFGNPHSINHEFGWKAEEGVERARH
jgi:cysteine desulfurase